MPGPVPGIHVFAAIAAAKKDVDARDERGMTSVQLSAP